MDNDELLRTWDLQSNSTRFEIREAAPSDTNRIIMWHTWAFVSLLVSMLTLVIIIAILRAPAKVRNNTFNTYLFWLVVPDFVFSFSCFITCFANAVAGHYLSDWMCKVQGFYTIFGVASNAWLNATVAVQLYRLLRKSRFHLKYTTPTHWDATKHSFLVYAFSALLAGIFIMETESDPMALPLQKGIACLPGEVDKASAVFFWAGFLPVLIGIPLTIVVWVSYKVNQQQLLPKAGRRRTLALFFTRLVIIFVVMWLPSLFFIFLGGGWWKSAWAVWAGGFWSHMQGAVSGIAAILKDDIYKVVINFLMCREHEETKDTYRVAVQSISAVLENGDEDEDKKKSSAKVTTDSWGDYGPHLEDVEYGTGREYTNHENKTNRNGLENARWPSQRPKRVNPRLKQFLEEAGKQSTVERGASSKSLSMSVNENAVPPLTTPRTVARSLLKALGSEESSEAVSTNHGTE